MKIFFVLGYGVPKDIMIDENYNRYLGFVFNKIFDEARGQSAYVGFCGGHTDCFPPYKRTEAGEMKKLFVHLAHRSFVRKETRNWHYIKEERSVCRLENFLYAYEYVKKENIKKLEITFFCEYTRRKRAKELIKRIFEGYKVNLESVDFDLSLNRYLDEEFIEKKEKRQVAWSIRALKDKKELKKFIQNHKDKLVFFREHDYINNPHVVKKWWNKNDILN